MLTFFDFFKKWLWVVGTAVTAPGSSARFDPEGSVPGRVILTGYVVLTLLVIFVGAIVARAVGVTPLDGSVLLLGLWLTLTTVGAAGTKDRKPKVVATTIGAGYTIALLLVTIVTLASFTGWVVVEAVDFHMPMNRAEFADKLYDFAKSGFLVFIGMVSGKVAK